MTLTPDGWTLLKAWEGCRLNAYPDPASGGEPWTIGYGHTGPDVCSGLTISQAQADAWLEADVAEAAAAVDRLLSPVALNPAQRDALVSFCFNVGAGALESSSLRRRLLAGEAAALVLPQELPRWCKGPNGPLEGLQLRRAAEVAHAQGSSAPPQAEAAPTTTLQLLDAVHHHRDLPHQCEAWQLLQRSLSPQQLSAFAQAFRQSAAALPQPTTSTPDPAPGAAGAPAQVQLAVPYFAQNDSATSQGRRMCFSSTCAMAAAFLQPGCLDGPGQADDHYLALVQRYGDSTNAQAQIQALAQLGITARCRTDGRIEHLVQQLQRGIPVPVGWLHKGPVTAPTGGGHWSLVIGWDPASRHLLMHDPNGEADLVGGGYVNPAIACGKAQHYSERNWGPRWMVEGPGSGWWLELGEQN
jgi:GH24 family phage-related lysozyme (muramidase)